MDAAAKRRTITRAVLAVILLAAGIYAVTRESAPETAEECQSETCLSLTGDNDDYRAYARYHSAESGSTNGRFHVWGPGGLDFTTPFQEWNEDDQTQLVHGQGSGYVCAEFQLSLGVADEDDGYMPGSKVCIELPPNWTRHRL